METISQRWEQEPPTAGSLCWVSEKEIESQRALALICSELAAVGLHMYVCSCEAITWGATTLTSLLYQNDRLCNTLHLFLFPIDFNQFRLTCIPHLHNHICTVYIHFYFNAYWFRTGAPAAVHTAIAPHCL